LAKNKTDIKADVANTVKATIKKELSTQTTAVGKQIKSLRTDVMGKLDDYEESMKFQSKRIDDLEGNEATATAKSTQMAKDLALKASTKEVDKKLEAINQDIKSQLRKVTDQLATYATASATASTSQTPPGPVDTTVRAITIDGIAELPNERLLARCQELCFYHMGYNFNEYHVEQVYRMGRERSAADQGIIDRPRTVFIMFNMQSTRDLVIKRRYMLRNKRVYVSEFFPREIEEDRKRLYCIMKKARSLREYDRKIRLVANQIILNGVSYGVNDFDSLPDNLHPKTSALSAATVLHSSLSVIRRLATTIGV
jgi:hypothetical protein